MKKFVAFVLIFVVAIAAFTPCCIFDNCQDDLVSKQDAPKKSNAEGTCSPFFACATCHGFVSTVEPITVPAPQVDHPQYYVVDCCYTSSAYTASPWQPPRLV